MTDRLSALHRLGLVARRATDARRTQRTRELGKAAGRRVVLAVQNCSVPRDRRVWREARALARAGYDVSVISPREAGDPARDVLEGIHLYRYPLPRPASGVLGYAWETAYCLGWTALYLGEVAIRGRFRIFQACNPPDTYFLLGWPLRLLGVRFVFDHHDLTPELYEAKFDRPQRVVQRLMLLLERLTFRTADFVFTTNDSMRQIAMTRGGVPEHKISVVRNGPDARIMQRSRERPELRRGRPFLGCYVGLLARQDGVESLLRSIRIYVRELGNNNCTFAIVGDGESLPQLRRLVAEFGLEEYVDLPGWQNDDGIRTYLSTATFGLCPEPKSPLNDRSSMIKTSEYMAFGLPVVAFDLHETRVTAGDAGVYVEPGDEHAYAVAIAELLNDAGRRAQMGQAGRERVQRFLAWERHVTSYLNAYAKIAGS